MKSILFSASSGCMPVVSSEQIKVHTNSRVWPSNLSPHNIPLTHILLVQITNGLLHLFAFSLSVFNIFTDDSFLSIGKAE